MITGYFRGWCGWCHSHLSGEGGAFRALTTSEKILGLLYSGALGAPTGF